MMQKQIFKYGDADFARFEEALGGGAIPGDFFHCGVLVYNGEKPLAKASLYYNPAIHYADDATAMVGTYRAEEDGEAVKLLFDTFQTEARSLGVHGLIGPMDGSTWENYRFHDNADLPLFLMETRHPAYYVQQWKENGFEAIAHYYSSKTNRLDFVSEEVDAIRTNLESRGISIRPIDLDNYEQELVRLHPFLLTGFESNFLYSPISLSSFLEKYLPLRPYLYAPFVLMAEDEGEVVGVFFCVQDFLDEVQKTLIIKTIARHPSARYRGLGHVMAAQIYASAREMGFTQIIHAFLKSDGTSTPISQHFFAEPFKTYSLYGKSI